MEGFINPSYRVALPKMKEKISISVDGKTLDILDRSVLKRRFRNRSHAFEYALIKILEELKDGTNK